VKVNEAVALAGEIGEISFDMKMLSLNAQIRALKGGKMRAIEVLAAQARGMADQNMAATLKVAQGLEHLSGTMADFSSVVTGISETHDRVQRELESVTQTFANELSSVRTTIVSELQGISEQCSRLCQNTMKLLEGIRFVSAAEKGLGSLLSLLEQLMSCTALFQGHSSRESQGWLDSFRQRYTLEVERVLHEGESAPVSELILWADNRPSPEFGANVELF